MDKYNYILLNDCKKALKHKEVPISALIVENEKIISHNYNKIESKKNAMAHAEILVIQKSYKKKKNWRLNNCTLYVTLEPCVMCAEVINKSRIKNIKYILKSNNLTNYERNFLQKFYAENKINIEQIKDEINYKEILQNFFQNRRKN